ncbi:MAG: hypothetical protein ACXVSE_03985 [Solirubrobacteraceae bacterium]
MSRRPAAAAHRSGRVGSLIGENATATCAAAVALLIMAGLGLYGWAWTDWDAEARPAVDALVAGHVAQFLHLAPAYGGSLILRAPFVMVTKLWHGGQLAIYRASAAPCLLATGALGVWLCARMRATGRSPWARTIALLLCVANPLTLSALQLGHPEELLGAVLCVGAVLCAMHERPTWAAVLLGLAIVNKEWAIVAVGPVLVALPEARVRALLIAGAVAGAVLAPLIIGASGGFVGQAAASGLSTGTIFQPWQLWWFLGSHGHVVKGLYGNVKVGYRTPPGWLGSLGHTLVVAIMPPLSLLYAGLRGRLGRRPANGPLLLLTLLMALRCVLDPWDTAYYALPFLLALVTWESLSFDRPPALALAGALAAWLIFQQTSIVTYRPSADMQAMVFAIVSVPTVVGLILALYAPGLSKLLTRRSPRPAPLGAAGWPGSPTRQAGVGT